jgi:signal transduction histidine kinase
MANGVVDPNWPAVLALSAHEVRGPLSVVLGYLRMLLSDRAGALTEQQRKLLELSAASCGRMKAVADEMSELAHIEDGKTTLNRAPVDLRAVLQKAVAMLPELPEREVRVTLSTGDGAASVLGDPERLRVAFTSIIAALRRELVTSAELRVHERLRRENGRTVSWIAIGAPGRVETLEATTPAELAIFDEWRGGCGLSLPVARRIIERHGGAIWSPPKDPAFDEAQDMTARPWKAGAVAMLPHA